MKNFSLNPMNIALVANLLKDKRIANDRLQALVLSASNDDTESIVRIALYLIGELPYKAPQRVYHNENTSQTFIIIDDDIITGRVHYAIIEHRKGELAMWTDHMDRKKWDERASRHGSYNLTQEELDLFTSKYE